MKQAAKPAVADAHARSYGPDAPVYGLTVADANRLGQDAMRRVRGAGLPLALAIAEPLFTSGNLEEGVAAAVIVGAQARNLGAEHFERFDAWANALTNEVNADGLSALASRCLSGRPSLVNTLKEWAASDNRFRRRAALTAFIPLVREGRFLSDALGVADLLLADGGRDGAERAGHLAHGSGPFATRTRRCIPQRARRCGLADRPRHRAEPGAPRAPLAGGSGVTQQASRPAATSIGRRIARGLLMAVLVGFVGTVISLVPALFIQSVFIGEAQRCIEQQELEMAAQGAVETTCEEDLSTTPTWLPTLLIGGGAALGVAGGFGYGYIGPVGRSSRQEPPWLPF